MQAKVILASVHIDASENNTCENIIIFLGRF